MMKTIKMARGWEDGDDDDDDNEYTTDVKALEISEKCQILCRQSFFLSGHLDFFPQDSRKKDLPKTLSFDSIMQSTTAS